MNKYITKRYISIKRIIKKTKLVSLSVSLTHVRDALIGHLSSWAAHVQ